MRKVRQIASPAAHPRRGRTSRGPRVRRSATRPSPKICAWSHGKPQLRPSRGAVADLACPAWWTRPPTFCVKRRNGVSGLPWQLSMRQFMTRSWLAVRNYSTALTRSRQPRDLRRLPPSNSGRLRLVSLNCDVRASGSLGSVDSMCPRAVVSRPHRRLGRLGICPWWRRRCRRVVRAEVEWLGQTPDCTVTDS